MFYGATETIKVARFIDSSVGVVLFLHSSTASGNNKKYLIAAFKY